MECLGKNVRIEKNITTTPMKVIQAFHKLVKQAIGKTAAD